MYADETTIAYLMKLSEIETAATKAKKRFENLPQRNEILEVRKKISALEEKLAPVVDLFNKTKGELSRLEGEDLKLSEKQVEVQKIIDSAKGDFRSVEARTKELDGLAKRRETVAFEHGRVTDEHTKLNALKESVESSLSVLHAKEAAIISSFKSEGGALKEDIAKLEAASDVILSSIPPEIAHAYRKAAAHCGGIGISELVGNRCGVCRSVLDDAHFLQLKRNAPLDICVHCKRLILVEV